MMSREAWRDYLGFLHSIAVAQPEAGKGLQDITEAACKRGRAYASEPSLAAHDAAIVPELPPLPLPSKGRSGIRLHAVRPHTVSA